ADVGSSSFPTLPISTRKRPTLHAKAIFDRQQRKFRVAQWRNNAASEASPLKRAHKGGSSVLRYCDRGEYLDQLSVSFGPLLHDHNCSILRAHAFFTCPNS